jgi:hypothetical protein
MARHGLPVERLAVDLRAAAAAAAGSPPGRSYHCVFQVGKGLHVGDVWDSEEQFNQFGKTLMPIPQAESLDAGQPDVLPTTIAMRA